MSRIENEYASTLGQASDLLHTLAIETAQALEMAQNTYEKTMSKASALLSEQTDKAMARLAEARERYSRLILDLSAQRKIEHDKRLDQIDAIYDAPVEREKAAPPKGEAESSVAREARLGREAQQREHDAAQDRQLDTESEGGPLVRAIPPHIRRHLRDGGILPLAAELAREKERRRANKDTAPHFVGVNQMGEPTPITTKDGATIVHDMRNGDAQAEAEQTISDAVDELVRGAI